jgi:hypothetical protein
MPLRAKVTWSPVPGGHERGRPADIGGSAGRDREAGQRLFGDAPAGGVGAAAFGGCRGAVEHVLASVRQGGQQVVCLGREGMLPRAARAVQPPDVPVAAGCGELMPHGQDWCDVDRASAQALAFAARRLEAESLGLVFAASAPTPELANLPDLAVEGLRDKDALALLDRALAGPIDAQVRDQIIAETRGNPLALLELPRGLTPPQLAGGFGFPGALGLARGLEDSFRRRFEALPERTRQLLLIAAADPTGDAALLWRAAFRLGLSGEAAVPAAQAGLADFGGRVRFRHPLVRSAAYRSASLRDAQRAHRALAKVTDAEADPDRRAWHLAQAAAGPDADVADELRYFPTDARTPDRPPRAARVELVPAGRRRGRRALHGHEAGRPLYSGRIASPVPAASELQAADAQPDPQPLS